MSTTIVHTNERQNDYFIEYFTIPPVYKNVARWKVLRRSRVSSKIFTTRCKLLSTDYRAIQVNKFYMINQHHQHQSASIPSPSWSSLPRHWLELDRTAQNLSLTWSSVGENKNNSQLKPASAVRAAALPMIILTGFFLLSRSSVLPGPQMIDVRSEIKIWISISNSGWGLPFWIKDIGEWLYEDWGN